jgi:autotransporter-associated beta strand protein
MSVLNLFLRTGLLVIVCLAGDGLAQTITIGTPTNDSRGVWHVPVTSSYQGNITNDWRIILPNTPTNLALQYFYLLPVGGESTATTSGGAGQGQYGDNIEEALRINLANRYNAIVICPSYSASQPPWYANNPTNPSIQQESYFLQAYPMVEALYPQPAWTSGHPHRVLAGFSKSGWGACSLGVRHPELFDGIVPWDAPLTDTSIGGWLYYTLASNDSVFGTTNNYWYYQINSNISNNVAALRLGTNRFGMLSMITNNPVHTTSGTVYIYNELNSFSISNTYWLRPDYLHRWYSGWVDDAARFLNQNFAAIPPAIVWTGNGSDNLWSTATNWSPGTNSNWGPVANAISGGMLSFDNTDAVTTQGAVTSEIASNLSISSLLFANSTSAPAIKAHTLQIDPGVSLVVTGSYNGNTLEVGQVSAYAVTDVAITGGGLLWLNNTNADFKVRSEVGLASSATSIGGELDMSGLAQFEANVRDVLVGSPSGYNTRGDVTLAGNNTITAGRILVGACLETSSYLNLFTNSSLNLGPTNTINANTVSIGYQRSGWGILQFAPGLNNPMFTLRGSAGGSSQCAVKIAYGNPTAQLSNGTSDQGTANFSAGSVDFLLSSLLIASTVSDNVTGNMVLDAGSVNANTITIAQVRSGSATGMTANGTLTNNGATITAGTVTLSDSAVSGSTANGTLTLNGGALLFGALQKGTSTGSGSATVNLNGGTLAGEDGTARTVSLPVNLGGNITLGQVAGGTGALTFNGPVTFASNVTLNVNVPVTLSTAIGQTGGVFGLTKAGAGTLTIGAAATYTGPTTVSNGTLMVNGSLNGQVFVEGGVLKGTGTINSNLTIASGIHIPGASPGIMQVKGNYTLASDATIQIEIYGTAPGTQYDQVNLNGGSGTVILAGNLQIVANTNLPVGSTFTIITNTGTAAVSGAFAGLPQNSDFYSSGIWWSINYSGGSGNDVVLTVLNTNLTAQTINFGPLSNKTYGDAPFTVSATASSGLPVSFSILSGPATISSNTITITGTGTVTVQASQAGNSNYQPAPNVNQSFTVLPANVMITSGIAANNKPYDGTVLATISSNNVVLVGVLPADMANARLSTNGYAANFVSTNAGTGIGVTVSGVALTGTAAGNYTLTQPVGLTANIGALGVSITSGITANNKPYDGMAVATISSNNVVLVGVLPADTANVRLSTNGYAANFVSTNAGTGIGVTVSGLALTGSAAGNYTLTQPVGLTANIGALGVSITSGITANNKPYDGTAAATISSNNVVLVGVLPADMANVTLSTNGYTASFASADVGDNIGVTVGGLTLTGSAAGNYTLTQPVGLTANIGALGVSITSGITANNKPYDGTAAATISSNNVVLVGVLPADMANVTLSTNGYTASFASADVGDNIGVTVGGLTLTGSAAGNYLLSQPSGLTANIMAPTPVIFSVGLTNRVITVMWTSVAGATYQLQYTTNMVIGADWIDVSTNITAIGSITGQTNAVGDAPQQFYRVLLQQGP